MGVNAAPLRFRGAAQAAGADGFTVVKGSGALPTEPKAALKAINDGLPKGAPKLTLDDVYIHYLEAANSNYIGDRSMYLAQSTLQNIGKGGKEGVSFLNSHRSGGLSTPAELPFGQTFAGRYEEGFDAAGNPAQRAWLAVYLRRGIKPNGNSGPSTDDLHAMVLSGALKDVSVGLGGGDVLCDVCGHSIDYYSEDARDDEGRLLCHHVPGTTRNMTDDEIAAAKARDARNSKGLASYSLFDASLYEISAVYDGAVPGAGVKQVLHLARGGQMTRGELRETLQEAWDIYGPLLPFDLSEVVEIKGAKMNEEELETDLPDVEPEVEPEEPETEVDDDHDVIVVEVAEVDAEGETELARLQSQLAQAQTDLKAARESVGQNARDKFAGAMKQRIAPVAQTHFATLHVALQQGTATPAMLENALNNLPKNKLFEPIPTDLTEVTPPVAPKNETAERDEADAKAYAAKRNRKPATGGN